VERKSSGLTTSKVANWYGVFEEQDEENFSLINFPFRPDVLCKIQYKEANFSLSLLFALFQYERNRSPHNRSNIVTSHNNKESQRRH
jgi:hypothetical protein